MKKCAYCGEELGSPLHDKTDEHIIPNSLLKLYPKQDISIYNTKRFVDNRGMTIADVCSSCNNGILSKLDSYGVYCKIKLPKVAKQKWTLLQVQIGQSCKGCI